jgi:hypothetical protein
MGNTFTVGLLLAAATEVPAASDAASKTPAKLDRSISFFALTASLPPAC